ncbi:MAG: DEAD/DEAH box helicase family protein [Spirochaetales bacterium]
MSIPFFDHPILNSPYQPPSRHWELDDTGQPTQRVETTRRPAKFVTPIPKPKKRGSKKKGPANEEMLFDEVGADISTEELNYDLTQTINSLRHQVGEWRALENPTDWKVTPETARLLQHWRTHPFHNQRPFFAQIEAVETIIWLTEVAPQVGKRGEVFLDHLHAANEQANPGLARLALKLATGAGKTTVMAMVIAWQTINAIRYRGSKKFTRGFLIVTPGITIKDRLRVLQPNDPDSYYLSRELVPTELLADLGKAKIVITNYHAFKLRETLEVSKGTRSLLKGRGDDLLTTETEGQMLQRVVPDLMGIKNIMVLNDEAHHCYQERPLTAEEESLKGDDRKEADENNEAARLWINGLAVVGRQLGLTRIVDLSATPFFLKGSGYREGTLFPWTMSDFSLMDAIECGIVKLPRVPVSDNIVGNEMPMFRNLWEHIRDKMPKKGRGQTSDLNPDDLPPPLMTALEALYGHYKLSFDVWQDAKMGVDPCFIVVCNNTSASKLVYDYISGYVRTDENGAETTVFGRFDLFRNHDEHGNPLPRPRTLLIDSEQLESGDALDDQFRKFAAPEIEQYRRDVIERTGDSQKADSLTDADILREVMNTVGKKGKLGESIRCVVSVSMLTEGWDTNTVTHVLGVRAFGTQLLCEQVIGRALRRQSYELNEEGLFNVEYADVLGIPFDFTAKPVISKPVKPRETIHVKAVNPERQALEIRFPNVKGYRVELPNEELRYRFSDASVLNLTPAEVGATSTQNSGIIGEMANLTLEHTGDVRPSQVIFALTAYIVQHHWRDTDDNPRVNLFGKLKPVVRQWIETCLKCSGGTHPAQLRYKYLANQAAEKIIAAITLAEMAQERPVLAVVDPYNPEGSTNHVNFTTSKTLRWEADSTKCPINWAILDSEWEGEFCRVVEQHPRVRAYVKNQGLGFEVPYVMGGESHRYLPDFIVLVEDGHGEDDLLHLVVEIKGYRGEDAVVKRQTMDTYWIPGVNNLKRYGRWAFVELKDLYDIGADFAAVVGPSTTKVLDSLGGPA